MTDGTAAATPAGDELFQRFLAWQAEQQDAAGVTPAPTPTIVDVLHALIRAVPLATEEVARTYHAAVEAWDKATNG